MTALLGVGMFFWVTVIGPSLDKRAGLSTPQTLEQPQNEETAALEDAKSGVIKTISGLEEVDVKPAEKLVEKVKTVVEPQTEEIVKSLPIERIDLHHIVIYITQDY